MRKILVVGLFIIVPSKVFAVAGVGDLVYDPATQAELVTMGKAVLDTYNTAVKTLDKMSEINNTISRSYGVYENARNFNLKDYANDFKQYGSFGGGSIGSKIAIIKSDLVNSKSTLESNYYYVEGQTQTLNELGQLLNISGSANENLEKSANSTPGEADVLTSQNTSITAILATEEAAARKAKEAREREGERAGLELLNGPSKLFDAFADRGNEGK